MKIKRLQTADFMGLPGIRDYDLSGGIVAFCGHNAGGKTSGLSAIRYVLTGIEPAGETVTNGKSRAAVQVEFDDGKKISRICYAAKGRSQKFYIGKHPTTLGDLNAELQRQAGGNRISDAKIIASSELIRNLSTQKLGDLLMSYIPELMTKEDVIEKITGLTDDAKKIVLDALPEGEFGVHVLDDMYNGFVENRKIAKRKIAEEKAVISSYDAVTPPEETKEQLEADLKDLTSRRDAAVTYRSEKEQYERLKKQADEHAAIIADLDKKIGSAAAVKHSDDEKNAAAVLLDAYRTTLTGAYSAMQAASADGKALKKAIETIGQPICPLSEKLVCTTDKSKVLSDLEKSLEECRKNYEKQKAAWERAQEKVKEVEDKIARINADDAEAKRIEALTAQRERLVKAMPKVPDMPAKGEDPSALEAQINSCRKKIQYLAEFERISRIRKQLSDNEQILAKYEMLADAFSPKGEVKKAVAAHYIDAFAAPCNEKAGKLFHGMHVDFVNENGITLKIDTDGSGRFLSFDSLSEGEKVCVTFLLMSTLANLSGFRVLILDELSVLDETTLGGLIDVLKEHKDEYDLAVIACVDHDDSKRVLEEKGVKIIQC